MSGLDAPILQQVTDPRTRLFQDAFALYETSIPRAEQKTRDEILAGLGREDVRFWAYTRGDEALGMSILFADRAHNTMLLEYLAVSPAARRGGIGSALFTASFEASRFDAATQLLIEVDSEAEDVSDAERAIRLKRKQFYRRLGCREVQGFNYILPLAHYGPAPRMSLLVLGADRAALDTVDLRRALAIIYREVYAQQSYDARLDLMFAGHGPQLQLV
ncbi:GNAT family N-acetyltransferase [Hyphomonas sp.]|uniref:GNAT family N-acetyltransferase n=1 Tax=Hyphomonas sp. TaxID=87 RepID=UPI0025B8BE85|nr:GNAT family N-acetyltransferase [Hyphomonas sp.]